MQAETVPAPETKAAETTGEVAGAFEDFMRTFEAFKARTTSASPRSSRSASPTC